MELNLKIPQKMLDLFTGTARYRVAYGGRGSAKSHSFARRAIVRALEPDMAGFRILCCRELQKSTKDSVHRLLIECIQDMKLSMFFEWGESFLRARNGADFIFRGLRSNIEEIKSLQGVKVCWVEEAQSASKRSLEILDPTIRASGSEIWAGFNPDQESDPIYQMFIPQGNRPPDAKVVNINWRDNPWFPDVLEKQRVRLARIDTDAYLHIWEGGFNRKSQAQVFAGKWFIEDFDPQSGWDGPYDGGDWGFANDPSVRVRVWLDLRDEDNTTLYVEREAFGYRTELPDLPELFSVYFPDARRAPILADCSRPETISYMATKGFDIAAAEKWEGSVEDGVEWMRGFDRIVIHSRCTNVAQEFKLYSYKVDRLTEKVLPVIIDMHNHGIDAIRYACQPMIKKRLYGFTDQQTKQNNRAEKTTEAPAMEEKTW